MRRSNILCKYRVNTLKSRNRMIFCSVKNRLMSGSRLFHIYPPLTRKQPRRFYFGRILTRSGADRFRAFRSTFDFFPHNFAACSKPPSKDIIIVKRPFQEPINATWLRVGPRSRDQGRHKNDNFIFSTTLINTSG